MSIKYTQYAFIFGKNPTLASTEIFAYLAKNRAPFVISSITREYVIIKIKENTIDAGNLMSCLGGVIKLGKVFESEKQSIDEQLKEFTSTIPEGNRYNLGMSWYNCPSINNAKKQRVGFDVKKIIQSKRPVRLVIAKQNSKLNSAEVHHNKLLTSGSEILILDGNKKFIATTIGIQDFEKYSLRDYDKPGRDAKSGMLPPKLARSMINIIPEKTDQIYDPFCGTGTILGEAYISNITAYGSDISEKAVGLAKENIKFIGEQFDLEKIDVEKTIKTGDASSIDLDWQNNKSTWIVTEVYLGKPLSPNPKEEVIKNEIINEVLMIKKFLKNISRKNNIKGGVIAMPFYSSKEKTYFLPIIDEIKNLGYTVVNPFGAYNDHLDLSIFREYLPKRQSILYRRENQTVGREIIIIRKDALRT